MVETGCAQGQSSNPAFKAYETQLKIGILQLTAQVSELTGRVAAQKTSVYGRLVQPPVALEKSMRWKANVMGFLGKAVVALAALRSTRFSRERRRKPTPGRTAGAVTARTYLRLL